MSAPIESRPRPIAGILPVWIAALVAGIVIVLVAPEHLTIVWLSLALAGSLVLAFGIQLAGGRSKGFIERIAVSVAGALAALGLVTLVTVVISLTSGA